MVEIPKDKRGKLDIELTWKAPRPGLDLAFDVYNEWGTKIGSVSPKKPGKGKKKKPKKSTSVGDGEPADKDAKAVKGKVYFDVPKGAKLTSLELHDSMFSGGVKVRL